MTKDPTTEQPPTPPDRNFRASRVPVTRFVLAGLGLFTLIAAAAGYAIKRERQLNYRYWDARTSGIADDRARIVSSWLQSRFEDTQETASFPVVIDFVRAAGRKKPFPPERIDRLTKMLDITSRFHGIAGTYVLDAEGRVQARSPHALPPPAKWPASVRSALQSGEPRIEFVEGIADRNFLAFITPVREGRSAASPAASTGPAIGFVMDLVDPAQEFFPLLTKEVIETQTGETLLVRREGDTIVFLSPLKYSLESPSPLRRLLNFPQFAARAAVEGREVFGEFRDYRGEPVFAATRRIPLAGWGLVRKIDLSEALEAYHRDAKLTVLGAILLTLLLIGLFWGVRQHELTRVTIEESGKFRDLLEAAPDGILIGNEIGQIELANQPAADMFGYSREELIKKPVESLISRTSTGTFQEEYQFLAFGIEGRPRRSVIELHALRKDGSTFPVEINLSLHRTYAEVLIISAFRDITERKRAEEALRSSGARLAEAQSISHVGSWEWDVASDRASWSDEMYRLYGLRPQTFVPNSKNSFERLHPEDKERVQGIIQETLQTGEPYTTDYRILLPGKTERLIHAEGGVHQDSAGTPVRMTGIVQDITERKRAEAALQQASAYNRSLIEASVDPLVTIASDGKITDVNFATEKVTGRTRGQLIGTDFCDYFTEPEKAREGYQQVFREGHVRDYELEIRHSNGHFTPVVYNASVYRDDAGGVIGVFAAARDITERKKAEEEIRKLNEGLELRVRQRTAELEAANKELEAFTYSVSHDLRAPLRHIDGFSKLLMDEDLAGLSEDSKRYLTRIREGTKHMGLLVDDLLNLARVGRKEIFLQVTGLTSLAREAAEEIKRENPERRIDWKIQLLPFVECDPGLMKQVFVNLLSNAAKYTRPRPHALIEVGTLSENGQTVVFVRDNGVGFSMKYADKLFGVFQRLHRAEDFEGTGIGLATVQRILHKHGGRIWAEAELDKGATFYFTFGVVEGQKMTERVPTAGSEVKVA